MMPFLKRPKKRSVTPGRFGRLDRLIFNLKKASKVENKEPSSCFCIKKPKIKIALIIGIALSTILILVGAMFKIESWPGGEYFLLLGLIGQVICITGLVIHMMTTGKNPDTVLELDPDKVPMTVKEVGENLRNDDLYV